MSWMRFDPDMLDHPKFEQYASRPQLWSHAVSLFYKACAYATKQRDLHPQRVELHGLVPRSVLSRLVPFGRAELVAERLCDVPLGFEHGLFERSGDDFRIHDFGDFAPPELREAAESQRVPLTGAERARRHRDAKRNGVVTDRNETRDGERVESNDASRPLPRSPSPSDLDLGLEKRDALVTVRDGERDEPSVTERDASRVTSPMGALSERLRVAYCERFAKAAPGIRVHMVASGPGNSFWLELARAVSDDTTGAKLFDAAFADEFIVGTGFTPQAIASARTRLLMNGAKTKATQRGWAPPASREQHKANVEAVAGKGATHAVTDL